MKTLSLNWSITFPNLTVKLFALFVLVIVIAIPTHAVAADYYPSKPIKLIIPYSAGGDTDKIALEIAPILAKHLGSLPFVLEYKPSDNGQAGIHALKASPPDGYTLMLGRLGNLILAPFVDEKVKPEWENLGYVGILDMQPMMCVVGQNSPFKTFRELIDGIKRNPGTVKYSTAGSGSIQNFYPVYFLRIAGLRYDAAKPTHFFGGGDALKALINGQVDFLCSNIPSISASIKQGKIRPLITNSKRPLEAYPEVPTVFQIGLRDLGRFQAWTALVTPAGVPEPVMNKLRNALKKMADDPDWIKSGTLSVGLNAIKTTQKPEEFVREQAAFYENLSVLTRLLK